MKGAEYKPARSSEPGSVRRARWISRVLDDLFRIPGTRRRFGLDPFLGFLPGVGDWLPLVISLDLLFSAARLGAGGWMLARMLGNIALDAVVGTVPLAGDLFDLGWKANRRNLALLEELLERPEYARRRSRLVVGSILAAAVAVVAGGIWLGWVVLRWLLGLI